MSPAPAQPTGISVHGILVAGIRACLFLVPVLPLLCANDPPGAAFGTPALYYPDVTLRAFAFRALVEVAFGGWMVLAFLQPRYRLGWTPLSVALLAWTAVLALANVFGVDPARSMWGNLERMEGFAGHLHLMALFVLAACMLRGEIFWRRFFAVSTVVCAVVCVFATAQFLRHELGIGGLPDWLSRMHVQDPLIGLRFRADARIGNPVWLGIYLALHVFVAAWLGSRPGRGRVVWLLLVPCFVGAMVLTGTRSALLGTLLGGVGTAALLCLIGRGRERVVAITVLGAAAALLLAGLVLNMVSPDAAQDVHLARRMIVSGEQAGARGILWRVGLDGFADHPWLGHGQECFRYVFDAHFAPELTFLRPYYDRAHNAIIKALVDAGVPGLLAWLSVLATMLWLLWRRSSLLPVERSVLTGAAVGHLVCNGFEFDTLTSSIVWVPLLALVHQSARARPALQAAARPAWAIAGVALGAIALVAVTAQRCVVVDLRAAHALGQATAQPVTQRADGYHPTVLPALELDTMAREEILLQLANQALEALGREGLPAQVKRNFAAPAIAGLARYTARPPVSVQSLTWLAYLYDATGQHVEAAATLRRAIELSPRRVFLHNELGRQLQLLGGLDEAEAAYRHAIELSPTHPEAKVRLLVMALEHGLSKIEAEMLQLLHSEDRPPRPPNRRVADAMLRHGRGETLLRLCERILRFAEDRADSNARARTRVRARYLNLLSAQLALGRVGEARATVERARAKLPPGDPGVAQLQQLLAAATAAPNGQGR